MTYLTLRRPVVNPIRIFNTPFAGRFTEPVRDNYTWTPSTDISETDDSYEVYAELPGVPMEDVHISLPPEVDANNIKAQFNDGVLTLSIPKPDDVKPKEIPITVQAEVNHTPEN